MGCSPSKGKLFSKSEGPGPQKAALAEVPHDGDVSRPVEEECTFLKADVKENEPPLPTEEHPVKESVACLVASDTTAASGETEDTELNVMPQEIFNDVIQTVNIKKTENKKKNRGKRRSSEKQMSSVLQAKVDFPPNMVRAHQAAYTFLNPNISKYETLLELLDQAAQTQVSLQPMMSALVLRFEEINQALEEMAEEGELMLKEHGDFMALPSGMMGPAVMQAKPSTTAASPPDPPPDLLQQLLQNSTEKMRLVGGSVQALGDTTLEEAVEYFSSLSKLLSGKLQTKQAVERRLTQVLARVEGAAMRKSNPEDSALHSEDSGIGGENGGENESLTGSERHRHHRGSAGSGSCGSGINIHCAFDTLPSNSSNLVGHNEDDEEEDEEEEDDEEEYEDDEDEGNTPERKRSNSSPPDPSQTFFYMRANYMQDQQTTVKRPLTAAIKPEHSSSTRCVNIMMELQKSQRDLDQRMKKMTEIRGYKQLAGPHYNMYRAGLRRHSLSGSAGAQNEPFKANQSHCTLPILAPQPPKRNSVRKLINTFSHGVDGRPGQILANIPPHIRRPRKSRILLFSDTVHGNEGGLVVNGNNNNNSWPDGRDDLDVDNLPPPPPEVLMDNSFQSTDGITGNEGRSQEGSVRTLPVIIQNTGVSQRLKASVQNVEVLPNRTSVRPSSISILPALPVRQDAFMGGQNSEPQPETDLDPNVEKASCLYNKAHKIIHLRNAGESPDKRNIAEIHSRVLISPQGKMGQRCESNEFCEGEMSSCSLPVTAPPVSRVRLPPSCPSVCHRFPSPPVFRPMTTSRPSSRPGSPRTVTRAADNIEEIIPSVSFRDARSVFCLKELQNPQNCISSGSSVLPRPWGEASRSRQPMRGIDSSTRRTQSEQRPSFTSHVEFSKDGNSVSNQAKGSELTTANRPGSPLMTGHAQLDPSAAVTTA